MKISDFQKNDVIKYIDTDNNEMWISVISDIDFVDSGETWYTLEDLYPTTNTWSYNDEAYDPLEYDVQEKLYSTKKRDKALQKEFRKKYPEYFV
jgi:hypothetical protein